MPRWIFGWGVAVALLALPALAHAQGAAAGVEEPLRAVEETVEDTAATAAEAVESEADEVSAIVNEDGSAAADAAAREGASLRDELYGRLEQTRVEFEELMKQTQATTGLTDNQIYGIAAGLVAGAAIADFMGGGGLVTISLAAGGAALGSYIGGQVDRPAEPALPD